MYLDVTLLKFKSVKTEFCHDALIDLTRGGDYQLYLGKIIKWQGLNSTQLQERLDFLTKMFDLDFENIPFKWSAETVEHKYFVYPKSGTDANISEHLSKK